MDDTLMNDLKERVRILEEESQILENENNILDKELQKIGQFKNHWLSDKEKKEHD